MNTGTTNAIERIDALLHTCTWCGHRLGNSPSPDFCSEGCQKAWHTRRCTDDESAKGPRTARAGVHGATGHAGEMFVSRARQPIPPDWLLGLDEHAPPMVELYEPPEAPDDLPASVRPGPRLRVQPSDLDNNNPFWTPLRRAHVVRWEIPRVRASTALWEVLEDLLPLARRVHAGLSVHDDSGRPQQRLTAEAEQARRDIQHRLQRELSAWPRINAPAA